jgi:hypothetical protein
MANSKFIPVRGKQADIASQPKRDGYIYFAYDTGNVYIDKFVDGEVSRYPVGSGASGIVYASGDGSSIFKMSVDDTDRNYRILMNALPDTEQVLPAPDSLIINADGRFFRVKSVDSAT